VDLIYLAPVETIQNVGVSNNNNNSETESCNEGSNLKESICFIKFTESGAKRF
jgi:hypothetical protein